jgi:hypothetical protein
MRRYAVLSIAMLAIASGGIVLAAGWDASSGEGKGELVDVSCGNIMGWLGLQVDWGHAVIGNDEIRSEGGEFGVDWSGDQYQLTIGTSGSTTASAIHTYEYREWGGTKCSVDLSSDTDASGSACRMMLDDEHWWWNPTVTLTDIQPTIKKLDENDQVIAIIGYDNIDDAYDPINVGVTGAGTQQNPASPGLPYHAQVVVNPGGNGTGSFAAQTDHVYSSSGQKLVITYTTNGSATSNCDNAAVFEWKLILTSTLSTAVD